MLPVMIRRFAEAATSDAPSVTLWGSGAPPREFLHVDDLAAACVTLLERYDDPMPINVGVSKDVTIRELVGMVANIVGYRGALEWDTSKPDGTPRKLLDVSRVLALGWPVRIGLLDGIRDTYDWYRRSR